MRNFVLSLFITLVISQHQLQAKTSVSTADFNVCFVSRFDTMDTHHNLFKRNYGLIPPSSGNKSFVNVYFTLSERERLSKLFFDSQLDKIPNNFKPDVLNPNLYNWSHDTVTYTFYFGDKQKTIHYTRKNVKQANRKMVVMLDKIRRFDSLFCSILYANDNVKSLPRTSTLNGDFVIEPLLFEPNNDSNKPAVSFGEFLKCFKPFDELQKNDFARVGVSENLPWINLKTELKFVETFKACKCLTNYFDSSKTNKWQLYNRAIYDMRRIQEEKNYYFVFLRKTCSQPTTNLDRYCSMLLLTYTKAGQVINKIYAGKEDIYNHCNYSVSLNPLSIIVQQANILEDTPYEGDSIPCTVTTTRFRGNMQGHIISNVLSKQKGSLSFNSTGHYVINER